MGETQMNSINISLLEKCHFATDGMGRYMDKIGG